MARNLQPKEYALSYNPTTDWNQAFIAFGNEKHYDSLGWSGVRL